MTEDDLASYARESGVCLKGLSVNDGAYFIDDVLYCYEVITDNYREGSILAKKEFCNSIGGVDVPHYVD